MAKGASTQVQNNALRNTNLQNTLGQAYTGDAASGLGGFAKSGGVTPGMTASAQQQAAGNVRSLFSRAKQNLTNRQRIQGGYAPGAGANERALTRDTAASTSDAVNNLNLGLYGLQAQNQLRAMQGLGSLGMGEMGIGAENLRTAQAAAAQPGWFNNIIAGIQAGGKTLGLGSW